MIDLPSLRDIRRESPGEFSLAVITAAVVVLDRRRGRHPAGDGVCRCCGMCATAIGHTRWCWYRTRQAGGCRLPAAPGSETEPGLIVYRFGADLFYANEYRFADEVQALVERAPTPVRWFVVDAGAITDIDYSAARSVLGLLEQLKGRGVNLIFARVSRYLRSDMDRHGVTAAVGEVRIFTTLHEAVATVRDDTHARQTTSSPGATGPHSA